MGFTSLVLVLAQPWIVDRSALIFSGTGARVQNGGPQTFKWFNQAWKLLNKITSFLLPWQYTFKNDKIKIIMVWSCFPVAIECLKIPQGQGFLPPPWLWTVRDHVWLTHVSRSAGFLPLPHLLLVYRCLSLSPFFFFLIFKTNMGLGLGPSCCLGIKQREPRLLSWVSGMANLFLDSGSGLSSGENQVLVPLGEFYFFNSFIET